MVRHRLTLVLILVASLATLAPLAYSSPPDPSWIPGVYDDDDFDNVVITLTSNNKGAFEGAALLFLKFLPITFEFVPHVNAGNSPLAIFPASEIRAPPTS